MNTLTILDLARSEQLDRPTMAAVRGGWKTRPPAAAFAMASRRRQGEVGKVENLDYTGETRSDLSITTTEKHHGHD
ncbi:hypothetical protein [Massilia aerilata]|uniref:Uncharacterized protein n=1 Tax=Massilia aerilata TaxID=453817 RepID=A0ABW0RXS6_9BURK